MAEAVRSDVLEHIFQRLKNTSPEIRKRAAEELGRYVSTIIADMSPDASVKLWDESINKRLFDLMHSQSNSERWGGLAALDHLLDVVEESVEKYNLYRLYNYVKLLLPNSDLNLMLAASRTLGRVVEIDSNAAVLGLGEEFMSFEVPAAIESMRLNSQEGSRHAAVLILKELASNSPSNFYAHIDLVFDNIPVVFKDRQPAIRHSGAELLASCFDIVASRERQKPYYQKMLLEAQLGLKQTQAEVAHGSLLTYRALFEHGGMFMDEHFVDASEHILRFKSHSDTLVQRTVIELIPILALYDTQTFSSHFLHKAMGHLLAQVDKQTERSYAFIAIGKTAHAVGSNIKPFLDPILTHIKNGLKTRGKKDPSYGDPLFQCLGMLVSAVGPNLTKALPDILDLMFVCGLSQALCQALTAITHGIASFSGTIQNRLLELLSTILSGKPYRPLGAPAVLSKTILSHNNKDVHRPSNEMNGGKKTPDLIILALRTLSTFDFTGHKLSGFVQTCVVPYLDDDFTEVRRVAALTCCHLLAKDPICYQSSNYSLDIVSGVLSKLLAMGIADPDGSIRQIVLKNLDEGFDKHLAQGENVRSLFTALNDEVFEIREIAIALIGRLGRHNPGFVVPLLRKALIQFLTELEYSNVVRYREDCTRLLTLLVSSTQQLIKPYALPMFRALLAKADDHNSTVAANVLMCLGELVAVAGEDAMPHVPELMQVIMSRLSDPALVKRDAALHTLGKICSNTGYVITPLIDYPQLMPALGKILRTEISQPVRREVVKVLGLLGAVDPYRKQTRLEESAEATESLANVPAVDPSSTQSGSDEYYQAVVINSLLTIMRDPSLISHHHTVVEAIMSIFKTQGLKCVPFLPEIIPAFTSVTKSSANRVLFHLQQLAILIGIIKHHIRNHVPAVITLVTELWDNATLQLAIASVIEAVSKAMGAEFRAFLSSTIPLLLRAFDGAVDEKKTATQIKILDTFLTFGATIEEYLHLVIPAIVQSYERSESSTTLRKKAVQIVDGLSRQVNLSNHASRIIHPLVRILETTHKEVRMVIMDTLCALVIQLGSDFAVFIPAVSKCLNRNGMSHAKYEYLVATLLSGERLPYETVVPEHLLNGNRTSDYSAPAEAAKMTVNQHHLRDAWDVSQISTKDEWVEWMHRLCIQFMKESPSHALRACTRLVGDYQPLAKELFNAAFLSCWGELQDQNQEDLVSSLETAISSPTSPADIAHRLLNLAEFMEHEEKPLPIEHHVLGEYAKKFHAYAKALHYKELEYFAGSTRDVIESLISLNTRLQQQDAAWGTLVVAREKYDITNHEEWYERLGIWQAALQGYNDKALTDPHSEEIQMGRMKCFHALGEWDQLSAIINEQWNSASPSRRQEIAPMGAAAAWAQDQWESMDEFINTMTNDSADKPFYRAILFVHQNKFPKALQQIAKARDNLDPELTSFIGDGYGRSYNIMVRAQMLAELEEIIMYKQYADQPERQQAMRRAWMKRLQGCQPDVEVWQRILQVRSLVLDPESDPIMWIKFSNLCRKSERMVLAEKTINSLLDSPRGRGHYREASQKAPPNVIYTQLKYMWANGVKDESIDYLHQFTESLQNDIRETEKGTHGTVSQHKLDEICRLVARCFFKQGQWEAEFIEDWSASNYQGILSSYYFATHYDSSWYKAWHMWALANFEVVGQLESQAFSSEQPDNDVLVAHVVQAMEGFFRSIGLRNEEPLQDTLRLLTLLFKFGTYEDVCQAMTSGLSNVNVETWLEVIPQLIGRIQTPSGKIRNIIIRILLEVGKHHPQALVFPLTVASQSPSKARKVVATNIMHEMLNHSPMIVAEARMVSRELNRIVVVWHELWHEALEEASRLCFTEKNPEGMIASLEPLHDLLETGAATIHENSFTRAFGEQLGQARRHCKVFLESLDTTELDKAWDIYYTVFRTIERQLKATQTLDLQYVSPTLLKARDLDLVVPGTYQSGKPLIKITGFSAKVDVFDSKQRPRRVTLTADNGKSYTFLLKGHEDLRQDERVMQLFNLVDSLLSTNAESFKRRLHITIYPVIPLAPRAGLIGWVNDTETLHALISDYRKSHKILPNLEYRLMLQMAPDYETLTFLQRLEVFEYALQNTSGQDLYRVFWLKSASSEHWLERRTTFTRSLAVNSMVGHILGLGDRHPSNILLERKSGQVVHIDFGDCFEIAMLRERYPEKVPFRLTRMIVQAMEVSGIEGSFRTTSELTMNVLRSSRESLLAVLEAFVYDPLISWRLMQIDTEIRKPEAVQGGARRKTMPDEEDIFNEEELAVQEVRNERALTVYNRVQNKLAGRDFEPNEVLSVTEQVTKLILQATSLENICQHFVGWCAFW